MFNKELFEKICNVSCTFGELEEFVSAINKKEFDSDSPFKKYYDVGKIISAIEKYQSNQIDDKFLAYWMTAYNWIIMGGFKNEHEEKISLKDFVVWEIVDWIDSLSFFDDSEDWYNLEEYKTAFKVLDYVLHNISCSKAVFAKRGYNEDDVIVLIVNDDLKYFIKIYGELNYIDKEVEFKKIALTDLVNEAKLLQSRNFRELIYCTWNVEE